MNNPDAPRPEAAAPAVGGELSLAQHFLLAMPAMGDERFARTVIYVCEHNQRGALGVVINRPSDLTLETLLERVDLHLEIEAYAADPVFLGGPVQVERGFVLHDQPTAGYTSTLSLPDGLALTTSRDVLEAVACGTGPKRLLVALGYSGWSPGQLEEEMRQNAWLTVPAEQAILFDVPHPQRFDAALGLLGISPAMLSAEAGHA